MAATVLIVDDDADLVRLIARFLEMQGVSTASASNGRDALAYLRDAGPVQVILLDLSMPIMDGWGFRRAQKADPAIASIPVIVLSGVAELDGSHTLDFAASLSKPISLPQVASTIHSLLRT